MGRFRRCFAAAALAVLHLAAARMSAAPALLLALSVALGWNYAPYALRRPR
ncbi:MAG: hypothetical protein WCA09_06870 [Burkholderiales bacterium]